MMKRTTIPFLSVDKIQSVTTEARKVLQQVLEGDAPHLIALHVAIEGPYIHLGCICLINAICSPSSSASLVLFMETPSKKRKIGKTIGRLLRA